jgi:hypothetical protein
MTGHSAIRHDKGVLHKWFGPNRGTHWTIAGSVAVIILGGYLVYSTRDSSPNTATTISAAEPTPAATAPAPPAPRTSEKVK